MQRGRFPPEAEVGGLANLAAPPLPRRAPLSHAAPPRASPGSPWLCRPPASCASPRPPWPPPGRLREDDRERDREREGRSAGLGQEKLGFRGRRASAGGATAQEAAAGAAPDAALRPEWDRSRRSLAERSWPHARRRRRRRHLGLHVNTRRGGGAMGGGGGRGHVASAQARSPAFPAGASAPCAAPRTRPCLPATAHRFQEAVPRARSSAPPVLGRQRPPLTRTGPVQRGTLQISQRKG